MLVGEPTHINHFILDFFKTVYLFIEGSLVLRIWWDTRRAVFQLRLDLIEFPFRFAVNESVDICPLYEKMTLGLIPDFL